MGITPAFGLFGHRLAYAHSMFGRTGERADPLVRERLRSVLLGLTMREAPRLLLCAAIIVLFDISMVLAGVKLPLAYLLSDVVQGTFAVVGAVLLLRNAVPRAAAPWLFTASIVVNNLATNYQFTFDPAGSGMGVVIILSSVYGAITLAWRPFLVGAAIMTTITTFTLMTTWPDYGPAWIVTYLTGLSVSAALLYGRREASTALARAQLEVEALALTDQLTGLLNRFGRHQAGEQLAAVSVRTGEPLSAVFIDVAGLKQVNDQHGHAAGDAVITATAEAIRAQARHADVIARWGGDEFLVLGLGAQQESSDVRQRIEAALASAYAGPWQPRIHIGTASTRTGDVDQLISAADDAMDKRHAGSRSDAPTAAAQR